MTLQAFWLLSHLTCFGSLRFRNLLIFDIVENGQLINERKLETECLENVLVSSLQVRCDFDLEGATCDLVSQENKFVRFAVEEDNRVRQTQ